MLTESELAVTDQEQDIGAAVDSLVKTSIQCVTAEKMMNTMLGIISKGTEHGTAGIKMPFIIWCNHAEKPVYCSGCVISKKILEK